MDELNRSQNSKLRSSQHVTIAVKVLMSTLTGTKILDIFWENIESENEYLLTIVTLLQQ